MALRLAGEDFSVVQGLDDHGWLREITRNDASPGLSLRQQGNAPGVRSRVPSGQRFLEMVRESDGALIGLLQENGGLELASAAGQDLRLAPGAGGYVMVAGLLKLVTGNNMVLSGGYIDECSTLYGKSGAGLAISSQAEAVDNPTTIQSRNGTNTAFLGRIKVHSFADVARIEVLNAALNIPTSTHATPIAGDLRWNATTNKLQIYSGTAWETVSSA